MEKLCVFCDHFGWNELDYTTYSTLTGTELHGGMTCARGQMNAIRFDSPKWKESFYRDSEVRPDDTAEFRRIISIAEKCPDYSPPKSSPTKREA